VITWFAKACRMKAVVLLLLSQTLGEKACACKRESKPCA
jgi:hypothetical protein